MKSDDIILFVFCYAVAFLIAVFITRAIFSIPTFLKLQKAQLQVLTEIAIKQGVKSEVLRTIHSYNELEARARTEEERAELEKSRIVAENSRK